jgi:hypothetical protein
VQVALWWVGEMPAPVPPINNPGFKIPEHLLDFNPSSTGESVMTAVFTPFKSLVEENVVLLLGVAGFGICVLVGAFVIKFVSGRGGPVNPHLTAYQRASFAEVEGEADEDMGMGY